MRADSPDDSSMRQMALGQTIRRERERLNLSQRELAAASRVHVTSLNKIEGGSKNLSLETLHRISRAMEMNTSELLLKAGL